MTNSTVNSAAIRPDAVARQDAVTRADGAIRADGVARRDGVERGAPDSLEEAAPAAPPIPAASVATLPQSYDMPGRARVESAGQRIHRMRAEGGTGLPDPASKAGCSATYIVDAPSGSGRTVQ